MLVKELIKKLQDQDPEADVYITWHSPDGDDFEGIIDVQKDANTVDILGTSIGVEY